MLSHVNYQFCLVPTRSPRSADIEDPPGAAPDNSGEEPSENREEELPVATDTRVGFVMVKEGSGLRIDEEGFLSTEDAPPESPLSLPKDGGDDH